MFLKASCALHARPADANHHLVLRVAGCAGRPSARRRRRASFPSAASAPRCSEGRSSALFAAAVSSPTCTAIEVHVARLTADRGIDQKSKTFTPTAGRSLARFARPLRPSGARPRPRPPPPPPPAAGLVDVVESRRHALHSTPVILAFPWHSVLCERANGQNVRRDHFCSCVSKHRFFRSAACATSKNFPFFLAMGRSKMWDRHSDTQYEAKRTAPGQNKQKFSKNLKIPDQSYGTFVGVRG